MCEPPCGECAVQCSILSPGGSCAKRVQWTKQRRRGWRSAPVFASAHRGAPRKSAKRKRARGKEFLSRVCGQKWVPPGAWRFCDTLRQEASWASCLGVLLLNACYSVKTLRGRYRRMALTGPPARSVLPRSGMPAKAGRHSRRSRLRGPAAASAGVPAGSYPSRPAREGGRRLPSLS